MGFKGYLAMMGFGTGLAWGAWVLILMTMNPYDAGTAAPLFFFSTLLLALIGTFSLFGIGYRIGIRKRSVTLTREVRMSFRHAVLLSGLLVASIWLGSRRELTWYAALGVFAVAAAVEMASLVIQASKRQ